MSATTNRFPKITEEGLADLRKRIGVKITDTIEPLNHEATRDAIRHYAHGIGDDNPLWTDPAYAQKTKYGAIVALPSFLFSTSRIVSGYCGGLSGVHAMWAGVVRMIFRSFWQISFCGDICFCMNVSTSSSMN